MKKFLLGLMTAGMIPGCFAYETVNNYSYNYNTNYNYVNAGSGYGYMTNKGMESGEIRAAGGWMVSKSGVRYAQPRWKSRMTLREQKQAEGRRTLANYN